MPRQRTDIRARQRRTDRAAAFAQRGAGDGGVIGEAHKARKLGWPERERGQHGKDIGPTVLTQTYFRSRRKFLVSGIDNHATGSKRKPVLGCDARSDVRLHVCHGRP
jgi:hypothetical protein